MFWAGVLLIRNVQYKCDENEFFIMWSKVLYVCSENEKLAFLIQMFNKKKENTYY